MSEFAWAAPAWETALKDAESEFSAARFLSLLEEAEEDELEDAVALLQQRGILLNIDNLPVGKSSPATEARLQKERSFLAGELRLRDFEEQDPLRLFLQEMDGMEVKLPDNLTPGLMSEGITEALTAAFLPAVQRCAYRYGGKGVLLMDLIQEGSMGLWQGISQWEGQPLQAYLEHCICCAMALAVVLQARQDGVGSRITGLIQSYRIAEGNLWQDLGRKPEIGEIAEELHISVALAEEIRKLMTDAAKEAPKEEEPQEDAENAVDATAYFQLRQRVNDLLEDLEPLDAKIITLLFGLESGSPMSPDAVADKLGIDEAEVLNRQQKAFLKLRNQ